MALATSSCSRCAAALPAPGSPCPACLLRGALDEPEGQPFGDYEIREAIGRGGMGVIYRARQRSADRVVALKMILAGELATEGEVSRFRAEAQAASRLDHPHIVPIYDVGEVDGRAYYTMKLMDGGSLADRLDEYRGDQRGAAELIARLARAVRHGHERGVLHRDLKPSNILLDEAGRPHVADFGVATQVGIDSAVTSSGTVVGTPSYMAPEQLGGRGSRLSTAIDVYSLGAILYELLSGRPPFTGDSTAEVLRKVCEVEPVPPRALDPKVDRDLETICLKCLEKDPGRRYGSAEELAEELGRYLREEPIAARPLGAPGRLGRWISKHRVASVAGFGALAILIAVAGAAVTVARAQEAELRQEALQRNVYAAQGVAGTVLFQLRELADLAERAAADPAIVALAAQPASREKNLAPAEEALVELGVGTTFVSATVFDTRGFPLARRPRPEADYFERSFEWRDYFRGASRLAQEGRQRPMAFASRAFQSEPTDEWRFSIAAPIFDGNGAWVGVLMASVRTASALGRLRIEGAVLIGKQDCERGKCDGPPRQGHLILMHDPPFTQGSAVPIESPKLEALEAAIARDPLAGRDQFRLLETAPTEADADHRDPVPGFEGRWLAGFAPVGDTGYVVIVQTREPRRRLIESLAAWAGGALLVGLSSLGIVLLLFGRRQRRRAADVRDEERT